MESDSEESRRSPNPAEVRVTAARRRRLQRRRAAAAQLAAAAAAVVVETSVMEVELGPDRVRRCRAISSMDDWPAFEHLVVAPQRDCVAVECQTVAVCVRPAPPVIYNAGVQTERTSTRDAAVGAQLSDRSWPESLSFDLRARHSPSHGYRGAGRVLKVGGAKNSAQSAENFFDVPLHFFVVPPPPPTE